MAYPNIFALLRLSEDRKTVTVAGPLKDLVPSPDEPATVFAVVTQVPGADRVVPTSLTDPEPTHEARAWGQSFYGRSGSVWELSLTAADDRAFEPGWAFVQAAAVTFSDAGQLVTYSWSRWSYLSDAEGEVS
jgi:hypothetical protein